MARTRIDTTIEVDAVISERHSSELEVTRHPVEKGADVTDHARVLPRKIALEGVFSNTPINRDEAEDRGNTAAGDRGYAAEQWAALRKIQDDRKLVTIATELETYSNMVLTSLERPQDAKTGDAVRFSATFQSIRQVESELVQLELGPRPNNVPEKPIQKKSKGKQPTEEKPEQKRSLLKKFTDWTGATTAGSGVSP